MQASLNFAMPSALISECPLDAEFASRPGPQPACRGCPNRSAARRACPSSSGSGGRRPSRTRSAGGRSGGGRWRTAGRRRRRTRSPRSCRRHGGRWTPGTCRPSPTWPAPPPRSRGTTATAERSDRRLWGRSCRSLRGLGSSVHVGTALHRDDHRCRRRGTTPLAPPWRVAPLRSAVTGRTRPVLLSRAPSAVSLLAVLLGRAVLPEAPG